jgi:hypothetical protein
MRLNWTFLLFFGTLGLHLQAATWTGGSGDWHVASNWNTGAVPGATDDVVISNGSPTIMAGATATCRNLSKSGFFSSLILQANTNLKISGDLNYTGGSIVTDPSSSITFSGTGLQLLKGNTPLTISNLSVANNVGLLMEKNVTLSGSLNLLSGSIFTNGFGLTTPSITGYSSSQFVVTGDNLGNPASGGGLKIAVAAGGSAFFPVGTKIGAYNPVSITNTSGGNDGYNVRAGLGGSTDAVQRSWDISNGGGTASISFEWATGEEGSTFNRTNCAVYKVSGGMIDYSGYAPQPGSAGNGSVGWSMGLSNVTIGSATFIINNNTGVLPIKLAAFSIEKTNDKEVLLQWHTDLYSNTDYFIVEKSAENLDFRPLAKVGANEKAQYQLKDVLTANQNTYYRLMMVDLEGEISYSEVLSLAADFTSNQLWAWPNPFAEELFFLAQSSKLLTSFRLRLLTLGGQVLWQCDYGQLEGLQSRQNFGHLPAGVYVLQSLERGRVLKSVKVVKRE